MSSAISGGDHGKDSRKRKVGEISDSAHSDSLNDSNPTAAYATSESGGNRDIEVGAIGDGNRANALVTNESTSAPSTKFNLKASEALRKSPTNDGIGNVYENLRYIVVRNDGKPESMIKLVGLKSLFAKQLPKMPRAYIARLVFDRRHTSLAILSDDPSLNDSDEDIIGGICYRAFDDMR